MLRHFLAAGARFSALLLLNLLFFPPHIVLAASTALFKTTILGTHVTCIAIRLSDPHIVVRAEVCQNFPGGDEPFPAMIHRLQPIAAIDGAYFSKATKAPIGDIVVRGHLIHRGMMGTALAITSDGVPTIKRVVWGHAADWTDYETVLACGPALVLDGQVDVFPEREGFGTDPDIGGAAPRIAVGYTADHHLLFVKMSAVTFAREALVMKTLGCVGAMNLDAGASTAMFYQGHFLVKPGRRLTNILCVYKR